MTPASAPETAMRPTKETYEPLQLAYDALNKTLFDGVLPQCLITLQRRKKSYGYFHAQRFGRDDGRVSDEIALNPSHFRSRPVPEILATLAHEMVHLWQHHYGAPGRGRYHNREWAARMKAIGLQPTDTGEEGGKETGEHMHHMIVPGGRFDRAVQKLLGRGFTLAWTEVPQQQAGDSSAGEDPAGRQEGKSGRRVKYACARCGLKAWAKHGAALLCGSDMAAMEPMGLSNASGAGPLRDRRR